MGRPLKGKKDIMDYSGMGEVMLELVVEHGGFPHFWIGQTMCSHSDSVDRWFIEAAGKRVRIKGRADGDENGDGKKKQ